MISVRKKLENRADAAANCIDRVKAILDVPEPNLITLKCLNDELNDLQRFYNNQSSFLKWAQPTFVITAAEMLNLRENLLSKIDTA